MRLLPGEPMRSHRPPKLSRDQDNDLAAAETQ